MLKGSRPPSASLKPRAIDDDDTDFSRKPKHRTVSHGCIESGPISPLSVAALIRPPTDFSLHDIKTQCAAATANDDSMGLNVDPGSLRMGCDDAPDKHRFPECCGREDGEEPTCRSLAQEVAFETCVATWPWQQESQELSLHGSESREQGCTDRGAPDSKYSVYRLQVDPTQEDRAVEIPLFSAARPHMRAFHLAWASFFVAFFTWFALTPLLSEVAETLDLSREVVWTSSILAVASSALTRVVVGPLNDKYGARVTMCGTLLAAAIPTALSGVLVQDATSLYLCRLFIGVAGSAFVTCQYWTTSFFCKEIAGTANALAAGWGNVGGGVAQLVIGSIVFPLLKRISEDKSSPSECAWRWSVALPAVMSLAMAFAVVAFGDDTPKGNISKRRKQGLVEPVSASRSLARGACNLNTMLLSVQYGTCFGVEITMTQAAALFFKEEFGQSTESAAAIASIFGFINLFARGIGGYCSDRTSAYAGMRGRLWCQVIMFVAEGLLVIVFAYTHTLAGAIFAMMMFSVFVQAAEGASYAIVPYVDHSVAGSVTGIVGAGGNLGGVAFALLFRELNYRRAFLWMGCAVIASAILSLGIRIPGHRSILRGHDASEIVEARTKAGLPDMVILDTHASDVDILEGPSSATSVDLAIDF
jgi:NNP family nitrate/nitrite transporter-like MFS transporter